MVRAIRELQGDTNAGASIHPLGSFLFQAFHFHAEGEQLFLLEEPFARHLVDTPPRALRWTGEFPAPSGYLQFPKQLFWSPVEETQGAEPLDGVFWTLSSEATVSFLVVGGVRTDRPGITLTELPPVELSEAEFWPDAQIRQDGADFAPTLPGGELGGLYSVDTLGEVLKLAGRVFAWVSARPEALGPPEEAPREGEAQHGSTQPSRLPFRRIRLSGSGTRNTG